MTDYMTVGKVSELLDLNPRTLRFYDKIGLVRPSSRSEGGYRLYSAQDLERFKFIIRAKEMGLTLDEMKSVLSLTDEGLCLSVKRRVGELLVRKIDEIENRLRELQILKEELSNFKKYLDEKDSLEKPGPGCSCLE